MKQNIAVEEFLAGRRVVIAKFVAHHYKEVQNKAKKVVGIVNLYEVQCADGKAPTVQTWWLFISPRENGLYRWWLNASLRGTLPPTQPRRYTVPLYVNKTQFLHSLQISSEQDVVLLLTDKAGHVLWRTAGPVSESKKAALTSFVMKTSSH